MLGSGSDATTDSVWQHCGHWKQFLAHLSPQAPNNISSPTPLSPTRPPRTGSSPLVRWHLGPRTDSLGSSSKISRRRRRNRSGSRRTPHRRGGSREGSGGSWRAGVLKVEVGTLKRVRYKGSGTGPGWTTLAPIRDEVAGRGTRPTSSCSPLELSSSHAPARLDWNRLPSTLNRSHGSQLGANF